MGFAGFQMRVIFERKGDYVREDECAISRYDIDAGLFIYGVICFFGKFRGDFPYKVFCLKGFEIPFKSFFRLNSKVGFPYRPFLPRAINLGV